MTTLLAVRGTTHGLQLRDSFGDLSVHDAAREGQLEMLRLLCNADSTQIDTPGQRVTPLYYAAENGHSQIVRSLLSCVPPPQDLLRPMFRAAYTNQPALVRIFLEYPSVQAMIPTSVEERAAFIRQHAGGNPNVICIMCECLRVSEGAVKSKS